MRKVLSTILMFILICTMLVACAKNSSVETESEAVNVKVDSVEVEKEVTLQIIHWNQLGQNIIEKFESENPGIKIQFEQFPVDKFIQVIKARIAADELPDILGAQEVDFQNYINEGLYMDLTNEQLLDNFLDNAVDELKVSSTDGKIYSVPTNAFSLGIWINRDIYEDNGVVIPTTFDELVIASDELLAKGITPFVQGIKDGWPIQQDMYSMFDVQAANGDIYNQCKTGEQLWSDDPIKSGFEKWASLFAKEGVLIEGSMGLTYEQAYQVFEQGSVAMWPMGSWATEFMKDKDGNPKDMPFNLDFIPIYATNNDGVKVIPGTYIGAMYSISAATSHPEEAKKFLDFLSKPENAAEYAKGSGVIFPVKGIDLEAAIPFGELVGPVTLDNNLLKPFNMSVDAAIEKQLTVCLQAIVAGLPIEAELEEMQRIQEQANQERK